MDRFASSEGKRLCTVGLLGWGGVGFLVRDFWYYSTSLEQRIAGTALVPFGAATLEHKISGTYWVSFRNSFQ